MDKDTLIKSFVKQWGYYDAVLNEDFERALRELISKACSEARETSSGGVYDLDNPDFDTLNWPPSIL